MMYLAQALNSETIFGIPQWKVGSGLVALTIVILLLMRERGIKVLCSLWVTVITLTISVVLVFLGSWAQVNEGLWEAQARWFKSWFIFRQAGDGWLVPPIFPGGHLLGTVLLVNLLAAHARRFHWHFQKVGIQIIHFGIILLLVGQFLTDELAVESMLSFREGETKQYTEMPRDSELVFTTDTPDGRERVVAIPDEILEKTANEKGLIQRDDLPFTVKVLNHGANGDVLERKLILDTFARLSGALAMVEGNYGAGDLVAIAKEAVASDGRTAVWRESLREAGESDLVDLVAATQRVAADPARLAKLRTELKTRFRTQMLEANERQGEESRYVAEQLKQGKTITEADLPVATNQGLGSRALLIPRPAQHDTDSRNLPYAILELSQKDKPLGTWLMQSITIRPQTVEVDGKKFQVSMRPERVYLPYTMSLIKATHDVYQGTDTPKDYRSRVLIDNPVTGERRETEIYMNQPLRYAGKTFYQSQMGNDQRNVKVKTSGLQVVENPGWLTPYFACLAVGLGLAWQFLWHLGKFFSKRIGLPAPEIGSPHPFLPIATIVFLLPDLWSLGLAITHYFKPEMWVSETGTVYNPGMVIVAFTCSLAIRIILGWQIWRGRYLGFALVFLSVMTMLLVPFAVKYFRDFGEMLWPVILAQAIVIGGVLTAILDRPVTSTANLAKQ
jgi:hypothetical protein